MKKFFRKCWFWIRYPFSSVHIQKVKHVASFYPLSPIDVDTAYQSMNYHYSLFKDMGEKYKWEFLERCFYLAREMGRDHMVVINEQWEERLG